MTHTLESLEKTARLLEPNATERQATRDQVIAYTERFLESLPEQKAFYGVSDQAMGLFDSPIEENPVRIEDALGLLEKNVDTQGLNPASAGHLGYIPAGGVYYASLGDYMAAALNRYAGIFYTGPGPVRMERMLADWMAHVVGYPGDAGGCLVSGGSIAHLTCIVTARDYCKIKGKDTERTVVYMSEQTHHCVSKALRIAGLGECIVRNIPLDERFRINPSALEQLVQTDKEQGLIPWMVIASVGTTDTGAVDPLDEIAAIAKRFKLWYHLDGAYGGFFMLCEEGRKKFRGIEKSDSIVVDPHKGLFLPYGLGVALVKNKKALHKSHYYMASYLQDGLQATEEPSPADLSPELTKHFRALRCWLPLKLHGVAPFRAALDEKLLLAKYFYEKVRDLPGFETGLPPDLSVVTFRYVPQQGDADKFNEALIQAINKDGRVFMSSTRIHGKFMLRVCILSFRTHRDTIDKTLEILNEKVAALNNAGREIKIT